jgi:hypothetical protein
MSSATSARRARFTGHGCAARGSEGDDSRLPVSRRRVHFMWPNGAGLNISAFEVCSILSKRLICLAPRAGFEPATIRLTVECSTAELPRNRRTKVRERAAYNKAFRACKGPNDWLRRYLKRGLESLRATGICRRFLPRGRAVGTPTAHSRYLPASRIGPPIRRNRPGVSMVPGSWELIRCQPL